MQRVSGVITPELRLAMENARDSVLGKPEVRTPDKAVCNDDGEYVGGVAWERSKQAKNISNSERAYTLGNSYQVQRNLAGPTVGAKVKGGEPSEHNELRLEAVQVCPTSVMSFATHTRCNRLRLPSRLRAWKAGQSLSAKLFVCRRR